MDPAPWRAAGSRFGLGRRVPANMWLLLRVDVNIRMLGRGVGCRRTAAHPPPLLPGDGRYTALAVVACCAAAVAGAAAVGARSGPERNNAPQITAPAPKMAAATQNPVV